MKIIQEKLLDIFPVYSRYYIKGGLAYKADREARRCYLSVNMDFTMGQYLFSHEGI